MPILGRVVAERSGHILHAGLMSKLLRVRSAWDIVDMPAAIQVQSPMAKVRRQESEVSTQGTQVEFLSPDS
jgi:UDP-3-O-acyl-N-acetylglucosamine deacetylase